MVCKVKKIGAWFRRAVSLSCFTGGFVLEEPDTPALVPALIEIRAEPAPSDEIVPPVVSSEQSYESDELVIEGVDPSILRRALGARLPTIWEVEAEGEESDDDVAVQVEAEFVGEELPEAAEFAGEEWSETQVEVAVVVEEQDEEDMVIEGVDPAILRRALGARLPTIYEVEGEGEDSDEEEIVEVEEEKEEEAVEEEAVEMAGKMTLGDYLKMAAA